METSEFSMELRKTGPFVNLGVGTWALELELELILQTSLFPVP